MNATQPLATSAGLTPEELAATLTRLGRANEITSYFSVDEMLPAAGQGIVALECLAANAPAQDAAWKINHAPSEEAASERRRARIDRFAPDEPARGVEQVRDAPRKGGAKASVFAVRDAPAGRQRAPRFEGRRFEQAPQGVLHGPPEGERMSSASLPNARSGSMDRLSRAVIRAASAEGSARAGR